MEYTVEIKIKADSPEEVEQKLTALQKLDACLSNDQLIWAADTLSRKPKLVEILSHAEGMTTAQIIAKVPEIAKLIKDEPNN